jgi:hypothetical protein
LTFFALPKIMNIKAVRLAITAPENGTGADNFYRVVEVFLFWGKGGIYEDS